MSKPTLTAGCFDKSVWIRVEGRGSFHISSGLKQFAINRVHRGYRSFVVDLTDCDLMDSTFMGTLAGIALRLREIGQGSLVVVGANDRNRMLLENLGLDQLFRVCKPGDPETPELPSDADLSPASKPAASEEEARITALTAHEALVEVDPENEAKFRDVLEYLKQQPSAPDSES